MSAIDATELVSVDEMGVNQSMTLARGRAPVGQRLREHRPNARTGHSTVVGAIGLGGVISLGMLPGASMNGDTFLGWVTSRLLPSLPANSLILWDNIRFHHRADVRAAVEGAGHRILKMPPYSPDLNPIEECWSKVKHFVRLLKPRTLEALRAALADAAQRVSCHDIRGWFVHAGYSAP